MSTTDRTPIELLEAIYPIAARTYLEQRDAVMGSDDVQALSRKTKLLIGIGVAAAAQSSLCTLMWTKMAYKAGVTKEEIAESIMTARLMKAATVNDTAAEALAWLGSQPSE